MNTTPPNTGEFGQRAAPPRLIVPKSANEALRPEAGTPPPRRSRQSPTSSSFSSTSSSRR